MILVCYCHTPTVQEFPWKEFIPLASPIVVILLFLIDRLIGYNLRKKETDRNWYFKVLIEPSIEKITKFYHDTITFYSEAATKLEANKTIAHNEFGALRAQEFFKFQELKRELEAEIIQPILSRYSFIGNSLTNILLELEDTYTKSLDEEKFSADEIKRFQLFVYTNRAGLLNKLYSPLKPRPNFFLRLVAGIKAKRTSHK